MNDLSQTSVIEIIIGEKRISLNIPELKNGQNNLEEIRIPYSLLRKYPYKNSYFLPNQEYTDRRKREHSRIRDWLILAATSVCLASITIPSPSTPLLPFKSVPFLVTPQTRPDLNVYASSNYECEVIEIAFSALSMLVKFAFYCLAK
jgi:hypothetical protein